MGTTVEKLNKVLETKEAIRTAINSKGGILTETDTFASYPNAIDSLPSGGGLKTVLDATKSAKYMFSNYNGESIEDLINYNDTENVEDFSYMFSMYDLNTYTTKLRNVISFDTKKGKIFTGMFKGVSNNQLSPITSIGNYNFNNAIKMDYAFAYSNINKDCIEINSPNLQTMYNAFAYTKIKELKITTSRNCNFNDMVSHGSTYYNSVKKAIINAAENSRFSNSFNNDTDLQYVELNAPKPLEQNGTFYACYNLETVYLNNLLNEDKTRNMFGNNYKLKNLVIKNADRVPTIPSTFFSNCYHFMGTTNTTYNPDGLKDGHIYVPDNMVENFKTATN